MPSINKLGLMVVGTTAFVVLVIYGSFVGIRRVFFTPEASPSPSFQAGDLTASPDPAEQDSDNDGLPDLIENIYRADPNNPDTDGDGIPDGEEIDAQRDPTLPGPNDSFSQQAIENADPNSYTSRYIATLPDDATREEVLNKEQLELFVEQHRGPLLPDVATDIKTLPAEQAGKEVVQQYLESISSLHNPDITAITSADIDAAFRLHYANGQPEPLQQLIDKLGQNVVTLKAVQTPAETQALHTKLIAASQALLNNAKLLQTMPQDFVGGLIGAKNIEDLGVTFQEIATEVLTLEQKYDLE